MKSTRLVLYIGLLAVPLALSLASPQSASSSAQNVICVGGSSGMGKAAALEALRQGGKVLLVSRTSEKLEIARNKLRLEIDGDDDRIETYELDASDEIAVEQFASSLADDTWDALVVSAAGPARHGPMATISTEDSRYMMESKFWTAYHCAKHISAKLRDGGAIVFVAGILNRRPGLNCVPLAIANGALEGLTRSLALEWGPRLRVNCLSPGFCDTERFDRMDPNRKQQMLDNTAASLPLQRVGQPEDMGKAIHYLVTAPFTTGIVLDVDGGHTIRQYASPTNDPMRKK